ncbi:hypothetical protein MRX96_056865 [Rhipicephalus microplus]
MYHPVQPTSHRIALRPLPPKTTASVVAEGSSKNSRKKKQAAASSTMERPSESAPARLNHAASPAPAALSKSSSSGGGKQAKAAQTTQAILQQPASSLTRSPLGLGPPSMIQGHRQVPLAGKQRGGELMVNGLADCEDFSTVVKGTKHRGQAHHAVTDGSTKSSTLGELALDVLDACGGPRSPGSGTGRPSPGVVSSPKKSGSSGSAIMNASSSSTGMLVSSVASLTLSSSKSHHRGEEGWKEVVRRSKKVTVPSAAISRVIGRCGCNINAIRESSGAHIEVEKQKGQGERYHLDPASAPFYFLCIFT